MTRVPKRKREQSTKDFPWKILALGNTFLFLLLALFLLFYVVDFSSSSTDEYTEEELLAQGYEKISDGFYGMILDGQERSLDEHFQTLGFNETQIRVGTQVATYEQFQNEYPLAVVFIDETMLEHLQETRGSFYTTDLLHTYEVMFPSYIAFYDDQEQELLDWFYFQTVNILE